MAETIPTPSYSPANTIAQATDLNPSIVDHPAVVTTLAQNPSLDAPTIAHATGFAQMYSTVKDGVAQSLKANPDTSSAPGFWADLQRYGKDAVNGATSFLDNVTKGVETGIGAAYHGAINAANTSANSAVEYLSGGGAHLVTDNGFMPKVEGHFDARQAASDVFYSPGLLAGVAPNEMASDTVQSRLANYTALNDAYSKNTDPTKAEDLYNQSLSAYNSYESALRLHQAHPYLEDAMQTFRNLSPEQLLGSNPEHNVFFNAAHTFAYYFSYAQKYGWGAALGNASVPLALAILTDGALSGEVGVGTAEYDTQLVAQGIKAEQRGTALDPETTQAIQEAQSRINARNLTDQMNINAKQDATLLADAKLNDIASQRTGWGAAARTTSTVVGAGMKPIAGILKTIGPVSSNVRMNLMYAVAQQQALADPVTAQLWHDTRTLNVYDNNGKAMGQSGTALIQMLGAHPGSMAFSLLSPVAGLSDFLLKWAGTDPIGAVGGVVGRAHTADGLSGILGKFFGGLGIHNLEDSFTAMRQYPSVNTAYEFMANAKGAGDILDRFPGTYTAKQATELSKLTTADEVAEWHGYAAEANTLLKPLAPMMGASDQLKMVLRQYLGAGAMKGQDWLFVLGHMNDEQILERYGLTRPEAEVEAASTDTEFRAINQLARWASTRFGRAPMYYDNALMRMVNTEFNPSEDNAITAVMDAYRIALFPEKLVHAIGDVMAGATAEERLTIFKNANDFIAMRRALAGVEGGVSTPLMDEISRSIHSQMSHFYTDGGSSKGVMSANDPTGAVSRTIDPISPDDIRTREVTAIKENQVGTYRFIDPRMARNMGVMARIAAKRVPSSMITNSAISFQAIENIERAVAWIRPSLADVTDRLDEMRANPPESIARNTRAVGGFNRAIALLKEAVDVNPDLEGVNLVDDYTGKFSKVHEDYVKLQDFESVAIEYSMLAKVADKASPEFLHALETLNSRIPDGLGVTSMEDLTSTMRQALRGHLEAYRTINDKFVEPLNDNFSWHDDFTKLSRDYRALFQDAEGNNLETNAITEADKKFADAFAARVARRPNFLNHWQESVDLLNLALNRSFVPLALFSGSWAFHIAVSEGTLNAVRNGFGESAASNIAARVARHMTNGGAIRYSDEERSALEKVSTHTLSGVMTLLRNIASGSVAGFEKGLLAGMDDGRRARLISDAVDALFYNDGHLHNMEIHHTSSTFAGYRMDGAWHDSAVGIDKNGEAKKTKAFPSPQWDSIRVRDPGGVSALSYWMRGGATSKVQAPVFQEMERLIRQQGIESLGPSGMRELSDEVMRDLATKQLGEKAAEKLTHKKLVAYAENNIPQSSVEAGINIKLLDLGKESYSSPEAFAELKDELVNFAYEHLGTLPQDILDRMNRTERPSSYFVNTTSNGNQTLLSAREGWANALVHDVLGTTTGVDEKITKMASGGMLTEDIPVIHSSLLDQVANNRVKGAEDLVEDIKAMKLGTEPAYIPTNKFRTSPLAAPGSGIEAMIRAGLNQLQFINRASDMAHAYIFGPVVNRMVRDPLYILEYHNAMEQMRSVYSGLSDLEMQTVASVRASTRMIRFVHNPLDKMVLEQNMRVIAPFYFAQNQAWRRAMRILYTDPGAFERYLKVSLGVTNWITYEEKNGNSPFINVPGGQALTWLVNNTFDPLGVMAGGFGPSGFGIGGYLSSVSSMFPTGSSYSPGAIAANIVRPAWGPVATIIGEIAKVLASHQPWMHNHVNRLVDATLGPLASQGGVANTIDPSSVMRATYDIIVAGVNVAEHGRLIGDSSTPSAVTSAQLLALQQEAEDRWTKSYNSVLENVASTVTFKDGKFLSRTAGEPPLNQEQLTQLTRNKTYMQRILGYTAQEFSQWMGGASPTSLSSHAQELVTSANMKAVRLMAAKAIASLVSPIAPDIAQMFNKDAQFAAIQAETKPDGTPKYTYAQAVQEFSDRFPGSYLDLVSRSYVVPDKGPWSETKASVDYIDTHPYTVQTYPIASAFMVPEHGIYYGPAFDTLLHHGLRERDDVQQFVNAALISSGQLFYKNVLEPEYGKNYTGLNQAALAYGHTSNAVWLQYHTGVEYSYQNAQAIKQMGEMVNDPKVPNEAFGGEVQRYNYKQLVDFANSEQTAYANARSKSEQSRLANNWYLTIQAMLKEKAYAPYASFIGQSMQYLLDQAHQ